MMGMGPGPGGGPGFGGGPGGPGPGGFGPGPMGPGGPHGFGPGPMGPGRMGPMIGPGRMGPMGPGMYGPGRMMFPPMIGPTPVPYTTGTNSTKGSGNSGYTVLYEENKDGTIKRTVIYGQPKRRPFLKRFFARIKIRLSNPFS